MINYMKSIQQQVEERKNEPAKEYTTCMKRKGWPRVAVEVCQKCKLKTCEKKS